MQVKQVFEAADISYDKDKNTFTIVDGGDFSMKDLGKIGSMQIKADAETISYYFRRS